MKTAYITQKFMRAVIGTNNVDHCARICTRLRCRP